ncbi:hypothetical protein [Paenarthrobacter nitroguajacolicus]
MTDRAAEEALTMQACHDQSARADVDKLPELMSPAAVKLYG